MDEKEEEVPVESSEIEEPPFNGVVVLKEIGADGGVATRVITSGNVQATEVETLLGLGLKGWREQIGL